MSVLLLGASLSGCVSTGSLSASAYGPQVDYFCDRYNSPNYYWDGYYSYRDAFGGRYYYDRDGDYYFYDDYGNCYYYQAYYDRYNYFVPNHGYFLSFYAPHLFFGFYYVGYPWFPSFYFHNHYTFNFYFYDRAPYWKHHHRKRADWNRADGGGWMKDESPSKKAGQGASTPPPSNGKEDNAGRGQERQKQLPAVNERSRTNPSQDKNRLGPVEVEPDKVRQKRRDEDGRRVPPEPGLGAQPRSNTREQKQPPATRERNLKNDKREDARPQDNGNDDDNPNLRPRSTPTSPRQQSPGRFEPGKMPETLAPVERRDNSAPARPQDENQSLPDTRNKKNDTPPTMEPRNSNPQPQAKPRNDNAAQPRSKPERGPQPKSGDESSDEPDTGD